MRSILHDIKCPYCSHEYDCDDFEGLNKDNELRETCHKCNKDFKVYVDFIPNFSDGYLSPFRSHENPLPSTISIPNKSR